MRGMVGDEMNLQDSVMFAGKGLAEQVLPTTREQCALQVSEGRLVSREGVKLLDEIDLQVQEGEILGIAGVANNGQHELAEIVIGAQF